MIKIHETDDPMTSGNSLLLAFRIFVPFALGYFLSYLFRNINSIIAPDLVAEIGLTAAGLGFLTGAYFLSFALFQLPLGVFLDRVGPRKTEPCLLLIASIGSLFFAFAETVTELILARALIGLGVSACLMASFKAFALWFPKEKLPFINGLVLMAGGLGAMSATAPVEFAVQITDWRSIFLGLAALSMVAAAAIFLIVPERSVGLKKTDVLSIKSLVGDINLILREPIFFRYVPICVLTQGSFLALQTLWIGPWLRDVSGMNRSSVAEGLLIVGAAMTAGYLATGLLASNLNKRGYKTETVVLWGIIIFILVEMALITGEQNNIVLFWSIFAFFGTSGSVIYAALSQNFDVHLLGRVSTMLNLLIFLCAFLMQWLVGVIINLFPNTDEGAFAITGYFTAFAVILILQLLGLIWFWVSRYIYVG